MSKNQNLFVESGNSPPRSPDQVRQRVELIRRGTPYGTLARLYAISQTCDLCPYPIQDLLLAALDHSTPVIHFARSTMPIAEAIAAANDPQNLRSAHATCNSAKRDLTREEWYRCGWNEREMPRLLSTSELRSLGQNSQHQRLILILAEESGAVGFTANDVIGAVNGRADWYERERLRNGVCRTLLRLIQRSFLTRVKIDYKTGAYRYFYARSKVVA